MAAIWMAAINMAGAGTYKNHIKTNCHLTIFSINGEKILSGFYDAALFFFVYKVLKIHDPVGVQGLHLDKYDGLPVLGDDINFAPGGMEINGDDLHAFFFKGSGGQFFPFPALAGIL